MKSERWQQVEQIFADALERPPVERARFVADACGGDAELEREVLSLLDSADSAGDYFSELADRAGIPAVNDDDDENLVGRRVGNYRLIALIGRGGMGAVYLAERDDEQFEKQVALKLLPLGMDSEESRHRFLLERQILARLEHPGIARLLDGGVTEDGTPYYVMDYVEGTPIDVYCDEHRLTVAERLKIFLSVCEAVQHAHRNLVVHRDLKPGNILVTDSGEIRLLDFGIARMIDREKAKEGTTFTQHARPMTLAYASPEQVRGESISTASDVYSLGILLYRLLTGYHPYASAFTSPTDAERTICEEEPTRPSTRVLRAAEPADDGSTASRATPAEVADARNTTVPRLGRDLTGDLDTIILMALRKEPGRRYPSVSHFAEDIHRYLSGLPVSARKDTLRYRTSRFVRRNKIAVGIAAAFVVLVVALAGLALRFAVTTAAQSRAIAHEAATTEQISALLIDMFRTADPTAGVGDTVRVRTLLDRGAEQIASTLQDEPEISLRMLDVLSQAYRNLGLYDRELALREEILNVERSVHGPEHPDVADALQQLAETEFERRRFHNAAPLFSEVIELRTSLGHDALAMAAAQLKLASSLRELGDPDSAEVLMDQVIATRSSYLGEDHFRTVEARLELAFVLRGKGELDSAEALYRAVIPLLRTHGDSGASILAPALNNLAYLHMTREEFEQAELLYREAVSYAQEWSTPPNVILLHNNLASVLDQQGKVAETEEVLLEAIRIAEDHWPEGHWRVGSSYGALGDFLMTVGDTATAEPFQRDRMESYIQTLGPDHAWTAFAKAVEGTCLTSAGRYPEAESLLLQAYAALRSSSGEDNSYTLDAVRRLVTLYESWGRLDQAERYRALLPRTEDGT